MGVNLIHLDLTEVEPGVPFRVNIGTFEIMFTPCGDGWHDNHEDVHWDDIEEVAGGLVEFLGSILEKYGGLPEISVHVPTKGIEA